MKSANKTPSELIDYIGDIIKERQSKSLPTFYTISIEQYEKTTPVAEKEEGYENFKQQVLKYMSDYNLTAITVQLYSGKSRNVKNPFQVFKVPLKKQNPTFFLGATDEEKNEKAEIQPIENNISVHRYYDEKFELQMRIMRVEMEKQILTERVNLLTEKYEQKLKDTESAGKERIKDMEQQILNLESEIRDFEREIASYEKAKHNSIGNIALGSVGARIVENFAKSDLGTGVLKGLLGIEGYETLQGHLAGIENEKANSEPEKQTARIISNNKNPREVALAFIQKVGEGLNDMYLRMLYDIAQLTAKNVNDLQVLWNLAGQIQKQREKSKEGTGDENKEEKDGDQTGQTENDTNQTD